MKQNNPPESRGDWEEEFYNSFVRMSPLAGRDMHNRPPLYETDFDDIDEIKSFIRQKKKEWETLARTEGIEEGKLEMLEKIRVESNRFADVRGLQSYLSSLQTKETKNNE